MKWKFATVRPFLKRGDVWLVLLAMAGLLAYLTLLPAAHPYAAADFSLGSAGAADEARAVASAHGLSLQEITVEPRQQAVLVDSLQGRLGRRAAIRLLTDDAGTAIPAYSWHVTGTAEAAGLDAVRMRLTSRGGLWALRYEATDEPPRRGVHREALQSLSDETREAWGSASDSLVQQRLRFIPEDRRASVTADSAGEATQAPDVDASRWHLGAAQAEALARYHLRRTALRGYTWSLDSLQYQSQSVVAAAPGSQVVRAHFSAAPGPAGVPFRTVATVTATGHLAGLATEVPARTDRQGAAQEASAADASDLISMQAVADGLTGLGYVGLAIGFLAVFIRRLGARMIDTQAALRDAVAGGLLAAALAASVALPEIIDDTDALWLGLLIGSVALSFMAVLGGLAIFAVSSAVDSYTREVWPVKLETLTLARRGSLRSVPAGLALLRGVGLGLLLLGAVTTLLWAWPSIPLTQEGTGLSPLTDLPFSHALFWVSSTGWYALFVGLLVILGFGATLFRWTKHGAGVIGGLALTFAVLQITPAETGLPPYDWLVAAMVGLGIGWAFWYYNVFTCIIGFFVLHVGWAAAPQWLMTAAPFALDALLAALVVLAICGIGVIGLVSGRTGQELAPYVPEYVREITRQQRLEQELDIARDVQNSFLPRTVPRVAGVDVAAMCLAAYEVGGDYYDFILLDDHRLAIAIGDVSGKGIQAAFYMTLVKGAVQALAREYDRPTEVLQRLNDQFYANAPAGTFITMIYGVLDLKQQTFTFARAGHNPLLVHRMGQRLPTSLRPTGMAIGLTRTAEFKEQLKAVTLALAPEDLLVFFTDGITEATGRSREQYGEPRLVQSLASAADADSAAGVLDGLRADVRLFTNGAARADDMTAVVLRLAATPDGSARADGAAEATPSLTGDSHAVGAR
ncbi:MAG: SpoIIE family protein phosphatase [Bacteroidetes bacterium]|jgi:MFS family permease|nr:SpoIIE family protein phosphatase [Bacteroidota bacterium]